jgi:hypothetical protein
MNKRLLKRHKRQVARAHERVKLSEPDVRTTEQIQADREASRPAGGWRGGSSAGYSGPSVRNSAAPATGSQAKGDG